MKPEPDNSMDPVDEASEESFPASDSPAYPAPSEEVEHKEAASRFEWSPDGKSAYLTYRRRSNAIVFVHVEVPPELEGRGVGSKLARAGLEFARAQRLEVIPMCPFVAKYISRHREYLDLVPAEHRSRVESPNP
jgi:predicted GNAT family acetyltransferase